MKRGMKGGDRGNGLVDRRRWWREGGIGVARLWGLGVYLLLFLCFLIILFFVVSGGLRCNV